MKLSRQGKTGKTPDGASPLALLDSQESRLARFADTRASRLQWQRVGAIIIPPTPPNHLLALASARVTWGGKLREQCSVHTHIYVYIQ